MPQPNPSAHRGLPTTHGLVGARTLAGIGVLSALTVCALGWLADRAGMEFVTPILGSFASTTKGRVVAGAAAGLAMATLLWFAVLLLSVMVGTAPILRRRVRQGQRKRPHAAVSAG